MGQGLEVFDANGRTTLSTGTRTLRVFAIIPFSPNSSGSYYNAGFNVGGAFWFVQPTNIVYGSLPSVQISNGLASWDNQSDYVGFIYFGAY